MKALFDSLCRHARLPFCALALLSSPLVAQEATGWTDRETRLANEYLSLLIRQPEYGRVVDLLWSLYEKRGATPLLLNNISAQAESSQHPSALLIQGHLLRKSGDLKQAATLYDRVLEQQPQHPLALRARADTARELADPATAATLLRRLAEQLPDASPEKAQAWLELGSLELASGKADQAAKTWEQAAQLRADDVELARQVAELLLRAGFPERAAAFYTRLTNQQDPQRRLSALLDLARIHEHAGQFTEADTALGRGLALLDFRDERYAEFFRRRVRLHERFGALDELRSTLQKAAASPQSREQDLRDLARFYALTVEPDARLQTLRDLVQRFSQSDDYRWELVRALLDHDGAEEAAKLLEERLKNDGTDLPAIVLLRCEADLRQGNTEAAMERLEKLLSVQGNESETEKQILVFAQSRTLDRVIERILKARLEREPNKPEAAFELAGFYRARKNPNAADQVLHQFTLGASNPTERQRRLNDAAAFLANGHDLDHAIRLARQAAESPNAGREEWVRLADLLTEQGDSSSAIALLEKAWQASTTDADRIDIDEQLFSVLMGEKKRDDASSRGTAGEFKLPDAFTGKGFASDDSAKPELETLPTAVLEYSRRLIAQQRTPAEQLRAIWWALRTSDHDAAYAIFWQLQIAPEGQLRELPLEAEKLLFELAQADHNHGLAIRVLSRLIRRDAGQKVRYILRLSELLMEAEQASPAAAMRAGWRSEGPPSHPIIQATQLLEQAYRETPDAEPLLSALTQCYLVQNRTNEALQLWRNAIQRQEAGAVQPLKERYAELLLRQNKLEEHIAIQTSLLEDETEVGRRREIFKRFLDRLLWTGQNHELPQELQDQRLKQIEDRLQELVRRHPFDGFYHEALAQIYERRGDAKQAFASMKQAYYTAPDTPFSLAQLRDAALRVNDLKSAIYFQKQITASSPAKDLATEARRLVEMLEQTFQIREADRVRRRLESRFSQDAAALEDLAKYYRDTGQDEAEQRVYQQVARIRPWDARAQLCLALKSLRLADEQSAEKHLREVLNQTPTISGKTTALEQLPLPLSDLRRTGAAGPVQELTELLDPAAGLDREDRDRLRAFLTLPRPEFCEFPETSEGIRLRAIEELARLLSQRQDETQEAWLRQWRQESAPALERLWACYYGGAKSEARALLAKILGGYRSLEADFCYLWLTVRSGGMREALQWVSQVGTDSAVQEHRRSLLLTVVSMLGDLNTYRYAKGELAALGEARVLRNTAILEITRRLQDQQRYIEALELGESLRSKAVSLANDYALFLARTAESAERWDLARTYLDRIVRGPVLPGRYRGTYDPYLYSLGAAQRLAPSIQQRNETLLQAWRQLQRIPDSGLTRLRRSTVAGLVGAEQEAANELSTFLTGRFLASRSMAEPRGNLVPQGSSRHEESVYLRNLWEETREIQSTLVQQGLGNVIQQVNQKLDRHWGATGLSSNPGMEFGEWRSGHLLRRLRQVDAPTRLRLIREHLSSVDLRLEISVDTLSELGGRLEASGLYPEAIEVYRQLPGRAPANPEYAHWLIRASESALDTRTGISFTLQLLRAEPPLKPPQPGDEVLREKHAHFLALDFDFEGLRRFGFLPVFSRVLPGRVPHEVPYLRELALLHERCGQPAEALAAWERLHAAAQANAQANVPLEAESYLHRARLLHRQGRSAEALNVLRQASPTAPAAGSTLGRDLLTLRAELAAQANEWADFHSLMMIAVERKSIDAIAHLSDLLHQHQRRDEALDFLTQAERSLKENSERFRLRLELLRLLSRDPAWTPDQGRPHILALLRLHNRDLSSLQTLLQWLAKESELERRSAWIHLLRQEARAGVDRPLAALALAAFAKHLPDQAQADLIHGWNAASDRDRVCVDLGAETLLAQGRARWAWEACQTHQSQSSLRLPYKQPITVHIAHALGDRVLVQELFAEVIRMPFPGGVKTVEWARAFEAVGESGLSREIYEAALTRLEATQGAQPDLTAAWVRFLMQRQEYDAAETHLMRQGWLLGKEIAPLIFELYQAWGKLELIEAELPKLHLPTGLAQETRYLVRQSLGQPPPPPIVATP